MSVGVLWSTTGTAPIVLMQNRVGEVLVTLADGSSQVYYLADILTAVAAVTR